MIARMKGNTRSPTLKLGLTSVLTVTQAYVFINLCQETMASVIGYPAPQDKSPRDFGTPSVFMVSPTEQGIWNPHAKFPRHLASPCKYSLLKSYTSITSVLAPLCKNTITWNIYSVPLFTFCWNCSRLTHLRWYQSPHGTLNHTIICFWHLTSAKQFNLHVVMVASLGLYIVYLSTCAISPWTGQSSVPLHHHQWLNGLQKQSQKVHSLNDCSAVVHMVHL